MKTLEKLFSLLMIAVVLLAGALPGFAQEVDTTKGGEGTITITNASKGQTYTIYKLFDATVGEGGIISYKLPEGKTAENFGGGQWFTVDAKGNIMAKENVDVSSAEFKTWAEANGTEVAKATAEDQSLTFTKVPYGYYFIKSSLGATLTVDSTNPSATVIDKNDTKPVIPDDSDGGKKIISTSGASNTTTAKIGDKVDFQVKFSATNFVTENKETKQITEYTIADTPTGLNIEQSSVKVMVGGQDVTSGATITKDAQTGKLTVKIPWVSGENSIYNSPADIVLSYSATVTKDAKEGAATNTADISYKTKGSDTDTPVPPTDPDKTKTTVKNYNFKLNKVNQKNATITGAQFKLFDAKTEGTEIKVVKEAEGTYRVAEAGEEGVLIDAGVATVKGLKGNTSYWMMKSRHQMVIIF